MTLKIRLICIIYLMNASPGFVLCRHAHKDIKNLSLYQINYITSVCLENYNYRRRCVFCLLFLYLFFCSSLSNICCLKLKLIWKH